MTFAALGSLEDFGDFRDLEVGDGTALESTPQDAAKASFRAVSCSGTTTPWRLKPRNNQRAFSAVGVFAS